MPINADIAYVTAEREYHEAQTKEEKLNALKKMLTTAPSHKGAEKLRKQIKERIVKIKEGLDKEARQKKVGSSFNIKKEGAARVVFVGLPNSGKSFVLEKLSGSPVEQREYPFSTQTPEVRMIDIDGAKLQGIEVPAMYEGFYSSERGPEFFSIIHNADLVAVIVDGREDIKKQLNSIFSEFEKSEIELTKKRKSQEAFKMFIPAIILVNRSGFFGSGIDGVNLDIINFKESQITLIKNILWEHIPMIRVFTRTGGKVAPKPVVMRKNSTIRELAERVHKDFVKNFKFAKVWGSSAFPGQQVGIDYILKDKDVVEVYTN